MDDNTIDIRDLNERYFEFLTEKRREDTSLCYTLRKSNFGERLDQGFWFYGSSNYLAVSFWSGMDWKNKTPNIALVITRNGEAFLEFNVSDSDEKKHFVEHEILPRFDQRMNSKSENRKYCIFKERLYSIDDAVKYLNSFLRHIKQEIDEIIKQYVSYSYGRTENGIGFIDLKDFLSTEKKIIRYRERYLMNNTISSAELASRPYSRFPHSEKPSHIAKFEVWNYGPIKHLRIGHIFPETRWIFFTGENGSGKTSLLKAIATCLGYRVLDKPNSLFEANATLYDDTNAKTNIYRINNQGVSRKKPAVVGLCMYGPYRLAKRINQTEDSFLQQFSKIGTFKSLFTDTAPLLNIEYQFALWQTDSRSRIKFEKRAYYIKDVLTSIVPGLYDVRLNLSETNGKIQYFVRPNSNGMDACEVEWEVLASGTKNVLGLITDIMIRMYAQQPHVVDPSEFRGVVLIDEIDLHLHPNAQRELVEHLAQIFPLLQFFVTTHSPIPLLGAPKNSRIYVLKQDDGEISIERMDNQVMFSRIMPNAILSSPIFNLKSLLPDQSDSLLIYSENYYSEINERTRFNSRIDEYVTNKREKELVRLLIEEEHSDETRK